MTQSSLFDKCVLHWTGKHATVIAGSTNVLHTRTYDGLYTVDKFTLKTNVIGSVLWEVPNGVISIDYLVVGGGGPGGRGGSCGGGGAGGVRSGNLSITNSHYSIQVGHGGICVGNYGNLGGESILGSIRANGGGSSKSGDGSAYSYNCNGGSGAGGSHADITGGLGNTPATTPAQGYNGGNGATDGSSYFHGGGGGGAGGAGSNGSSSSSGAGGPGIQSSITGSAVWYAAGGGGAGRTGSTWSGASGGSGIGGNGSITQGSNGADGTGSGGGSSGTSTSYLGGRGGTGVVILRYLTPSTQYSNVIYSEYDEFPIIPSGVTVTSAGSWTKSGQVNGNKLLNFDGSSNYISLSDNAAWDFWNEACSLTCWVKFGNISNSFIFIKQATDASNWYAVYWAPSSLLFQRYISAANNGNHSIAFSPSLDTWYHVAFTKTAGGSAPIIYMNGMSQTITSPVVQSDTVTTFTGPFTIGGHSTGFSNGVIKDLMIWKGRALSQLEIITIMNRTSPYAITNWYPDQQGRYMK